MASIQKITPCLWFDKNAEEAVKYYTGIFANSGIIRQSFYGEEGFEIHGMPAGTILAIEFTLEGQDFLAMNGGPQFTFNEAVSLIVNCGNQEEVNYYWDKLGAGGDPKAQVCGWLKDKFGLSWQVMPTVLNEMLIDPDEKKSGRVMEALLNMQKLSIYELQKAYDDA